MRRVLQGLTRQAAGRGRGQADPLTADDVAAIMATASIPRRTGRGMESEADAADRGAIDRALVAVLFQGGLRRWWKSSRMVAHYAAAVAAEQGAVATYL